MSPIRLTRMLGTSRVVVSLCLGVSLRRVPDLIFLIDWKLSCGHRWSE